MPSILLGLKKENLKPVTEVPLLDRLDYQPLVVKLAPPQEFLERNFRNRTSENNRNKAYIRD